MTSINTNLAAVSALRTLQATNTALDATQSRISTGLKIGEAKDNAAYWSISTSLKSDNKAMATVKDALSLGAATVDTAYQGLNAAVDVLNEIKSKLTAATQAGIDKAAVQAEIKSLQDQLKSIASSSTFSGENWLSVDSTATDYNPDKAVVSSFTRDASGSVALGTITVDVSKVALFDDGTNKNGILDTRVALGNLIVGGLGAPGAGGNANDAGLKNVATPAGKGSASFTVVALADTIDGADKLSFRVGIDGAASGTLVELSASELNTIKTASTLDAQGAALVTALTSKFSSLSIAATATYDNATDKLTITSNTLGGASAVAITASGGGAASGIAGTDDAVGGTDHGFNDTLGLTSAASAAPPAAVLTFDDFGSDPVTLDGDDAITFNIAVDGGTTKTIRIDQSVVNSAISGETGGEITNLADMKLVMAKALENAGVTSVTVGQNAGATAVTLTSKIIGSNSAVAVSDLAVANSAKVMSVSEIDITKLADLGATTGAQQTQVMKSYIDVVNAAINKVTAAASSLGAVAKRIDLQSTFVQNLMDTIDKGVSGLVDADMNEESTRLQALQVKQQLGVQSLSIANQSAQNVLSLFRG